jgi:hypothetical protein
MFFILITYSHLNIMLVQALFGIHDLPANVTLENDVDLRMLNRDMLFHFSDIESFEIAKTTLEFTKL